MEALLNETDYKILLLLARFKFVVISLMLPQLGKSVGYVRTQLARLASLGYIKSYRLDRSGKAENMYYLTEAGKALILQHHKVFDGDIKLVVGTPMFVKDYVHRRSMVSLTMSVYDALTQHGFKVVDMLSYFDKLGENRKTGSLEAKTKLPLAKDKPEPFFIPDGIILAQKDEINRMFFLEMYCDASSTRVLEQIQKHVVAIAEGTPAIKFGIADNPLVLSAFEHDGVRKKTIEKLAARQEFAPFAHLFYFATLIELQQNSTAWHTVTNELIQLS